MVDYTSEGLKDLKYVTVTVKLKTSINLDTKGYFVGVRPIVDKDFSVAKAKDMYIWIYRKGSVHIFHLDYYYIDEICFGLGDKSATSATKMYRNVEEDQKIAIDRLRDMAVAMRVNGAGKANGLIDYEKYTSVPTVVKNDIELKSTSKPDGSTGSANYSTGQGAYKQWEKKVVSTFSFKRTTRYPIVEAIEAMNVKIQEIKNDVYEPPKLKRIPADTKAMVKADDDDDDYGVAGYPYMCG